MVSRIQWEVSILKLKILLNGNIGIWLLKIEDSLEVIFDGTARCRPNCMFRALYLMAERLHLSTAQLAKKEISFVLMNITHKMWDKSVTCE